MIDVDVNFLGGQKLRLPDMSKEEVQKLEVEMERKGDYYYENKTYDLTFHINCNNIAYYRVIEYSENNQSSESYSPDEYIEY